MHRHMKKIYVVVIILGIFLLLFSSVVSGGKGKVYSLTIDGAISPATADYFNRGLALAVDDNADLLLLHLNTPGGLDKSMRVMIQTILDSPIPVVIYVSPKGSRAASAGTYLIYASHIAAMAPATNLGSATPVSIGMIKPPPLDKEKDSGDSSDETDAGDMEIDSVMQHKMVNDAEAYILSLAQLRGRNEKWAMEAVRKASNLSATDALDKNVIDIIAYDEASLIKSLHQREVMVSEKKITINLVDPEVIEFKVDWRTDLLIIITDPSVAYLLLLAGIYGLMFEFLHPGSLLPGTVGAICLLVSLYGLNMLPINLAGLALLLFGIMLMVAEAFVPSFGILGIGGISAFTIGSFMLMDSSIPGYQIAPALIITTSLLSGFIVIFCVSLILKSRRDPLVSGVDELINHLAIAVEDFEGAGRVMIRGEIWQADCEDKIQKEQKVRVKAIDGLRLKVTTED